MTRHMVFCVIVQPLADTVRVTVDAGEDGQAEITAGTAGHALALAVPLMHGIVEPDLTSLPDRLAELLRLPDAPDGPRDMGGTA